MPKKSKKIEEEIAQGQPKPGISSFSLLDTPKLSVEETKPEEENKPVTSVTPVTSEEEAGETEESPPEETEESKEPGPTEEKTQTEKGPASSEEVKEWLKDIRPDTTKEVEKSGGPNFRLILFLLGALLLIGAVVGGIFYFKSKVSKISAPNEEPTEALPTATVTPTPAETEEEEKLDLSKYKVNILNGSGIPGEAKKVADSLTAEGFKDIKTANAASYDFTTTEVSLKSDLPDSVYTKIETILSKTYNVAKSKTSLDKSSSYDIVITVGTKK